MTSLRFCRPFVIFGISKRFQRWKCACQKPSTCLPKSCMSKWQKPATNLTGIRLHMVAKEEKCPLSQVHGNRSDSHILLKLRNACFCTTFNVRPRATTSTETGKALKASYYPIQTCRMQSYSTVCLISLIPYRCLCLLFLQASWLSFLTDERKSIWIDLNYKI